MKRLLVLVLFTPVIALAASAFDGKWTIDESSMKVSGKPNKMELANGSYTCGSCAPTYTVKADGMDQAVAGQAYEDHVAVKVIDNSTVQFTRKKDGKVIDETTLTVAADGKSIAGKFTDNTGEKPVTGAFTEKRVAAGAAGSHAISGSWMQDSVSGMSEAGRTSTFKESDNGIMISWNGQMIDGKFDGKLAAWVNDPGKTMSSFKKISDTKFEEYDRREGKLTDVISFSISADGKTLTEVDEDKEHGSTTSMSLKKQ